MSVENLPDIVKRLKTLRIISGRSQHAMAKAAGIGVETLNAGESGALKRGWPVEVLLKYAAVFGMSIGLTSNADWPDLSRYTVGELATLAGMITDELVGRIQDVDRDDDADLHADRDRDDDPGSAPGGTLDCPQDRRLAQG